MNKTPTRKNFSLLIESLKGICTDTRKLSLGCEGKIPRWSVPSWKRNELIKLVLNNVIGITDRHLSALNIRDGLEPNDLLIRAKELVQEDS